MLKKFVSGVLTRNPQALVLLLCGAAIGALAVTAAVSGIQLGDASSNNDGGKIFPTNGFKEPSSAESNLRESRSRTGEIGLDELAGIRNPDTRSLGLQTLLDGASVSDLRGLLAETSGSLSGRIREEFQGTILEKLAIVDPQLAIRTIEDLQLEPEADFVSLIYQIWSITDLDLAVASASSLVEAWRNYAAEGILIAREDLPDLDRNRIAVKLVGEDFADSMLTILKIREPMDNPEAEWSEFMSKNQDRLGSLNIYEAIHAGTIAAELALSIGIDGAIARLEEALPTISSKVTAIRTVLFEISQQDPDRALEIAAGFTNEEYYPIASTLVLQLAASNPQSALDTVATIEALGVRGRLQRDVVSSWAKSEPYDLVTALESLPENVRTFAQEQALVTIAGDSTERASQMLPDLKSFESQAKVADAILANWIKLDPVAAIEWARTDPRVGHLREHLLPSALAQLTMSDPTEAMRIALLEDAGSNGIGHEAVVIHHVARSSIEEALELLPKARDAATRVSALSLIGKTLVRGGSAERAIELGRRLEQKNDRANYIRALASDLMIERPGWLADNLEALPTNRDRMRIATLLEMTPRTKRELNRRQLNKVSRYSMHQSSTIDDASPEPYE